MQPQPLTSEQLLHLIQAVFPPLADDRKLAILVDLPVTSSDDHPSWQQRRIFAALLKESLDAGRISLGLEEVALVAYAAVGTNNGDLPLICCKITGALPPTSQGLLGLAGRLETDALFQSFQLFIAPTQYSATAPLKIAARQYKFRAATMPGFSAEMVPALQIDYVEVARRLEVLKEKLDPAESASILFLVRGTDHYFFDIDLRYRSTHLSSGRFPDAWHGGQPPQRRGLYRPL